MDIAVDESFRRVLERNKLNDFESLWSLEGELVEEGNIKPKSGHSHVVRVHLQTDAGPLCVYMKKQTNYATTLSRLMHRTSSICRREYSNIACWKSKGIPVLDAVYCGEIKNPLRGILITVALDEYTPLDILLESASPQARREMLASTAKLIRRIHDAGWVHRCFFPKHVFVPSEHKALPVKMIDLEKARKAWFGVHDYMRDLSAFMRRITWHDNVERDAFLDTYFGTTDMTLYRKIYMYLMRERIAQKQANVSTRSV